MSAITKNIGLTGIGGIAAGLLGGDDASDKLFGDNIPGELKRPRLTSFEAPGLSAEFLSPEQLALRRAPGVESMLSGISSAFTDQANQIGGLRPLVEPGFGRLTESGIRAVRDARRATMGDLRQNLARRRVLGSSFGADDLARTGAEFAKAEDKVTSEAFIKELAMSNELINQQAQAKANSFLQSLNQTNIESQLAAQMASGVSSILSNNAQMIGQMTNTGADRMLNVGGTIAGSFFGLG